MQSTLAQSAASLWGGIRKQLEDERTRISREISEYPAPIAACDAHINHLLAEREKVSEELARLDEAAKRSLATDNPGAMVDDFVRSSVYLKKR